ncbi:Exocyst complex component EXO84 [Nakaseomyces bracarensis]|uniref:Exocyst complex component EXO84 n=1 Tax=Nakaseomyces bracarensis TaxID=273131 RepID=A0ABR4NY56_9SACH
MVDFSLRKARNNWKNKNNTPSKGGNTSQTSLKNAKKEKDKGKEKEKDKDKDKKPVVNPYANLTVPSQNSLPKVDVKERNRAASSMQRRLSIHTANYAAPNLDYSMPLPNAMIDQMEGQDLNAAPETASLVKPPIVQQKGSSSGRASERGLRVPDGNRVRLGGLGASGVSAMSSRMTMAAPMNPMNPYASLFHPASLRKILADPHFSAKRFIHERLSEASAVDIDLFTSNLTELSTDVQEEVKRNIYKSYNEIMTVNNDLHEASSELKQLRSSIGELTKIMDQFVLVAKSRLQNDEQQKLLQQSRPESPHKTSSNSLLPALKPGSNFLNQRRDRTSVMILEKMWDSQLNTLFKNIDGAQKALGSVPNRHLLMESSDWLELNASTLKPLQQVHIYILNDTVLVAGKTKSKQHDLVVSQCCPLRDITVTVEGNSNSRLAFNFGSNNTCLYECKERGEYLRVLDAFRKAKDDLRDITENEKQNSKRIKESLVYLQNTQQTPGREGSKSPMKRRSMGLSPPSATRPLSSSMDQFVLQNLSLSVHSRSKSSDWNSSAQKFKIVDDLIEEVDIDLARLKFDAAVNTLLDAEQQLSTLRTLIKKDDTIVFNVLNLKLDQRRDDIVLKVSQRNLFINEVAHLRNGVRTLVRLGLPEDGLDLLLQNRSNVIEQLLLQIGSSDHPSLYLTQLAVVRFQIIKRTVIAFRELFHKDHDKLSSMLVNWCNKQVDQHFQLVDKQLLNDDVLSPEAIKYSRKQIDDLKTVGLDFVYKLDEFMKKNINKLN